MYGLVRLHYSEAEGSEYDARRHLERHRRDRHPRHETGEERSQERHDTHDQQTGKGDLRHEMTA